MEVTARKWRPQSFEDFIGQEHVIHSLQNSFRSDRLGHAYLFSGPRGVGKTSCARVFARALNCLNNGPSATPCGTCKNCTEITAGNSVDVIEIDGASNRGIDHIREIRDNLQFLPSGSRYKVYIIDEVHMLTDQAFNALLKTLEEPPPHVIFLFATTEAHKVKITIRSRCQHFRFRRLSLDQIAKQLESILNSYNIAYEPQALKWIARAADGSMRDSQSLLDQCILYCGEKVELKKVQEILGTIAQERFIIFFENLTQKNAGAMYQFINQLYYEGEDIGFFIEGLIQQLRYCILIQHNINNFQELEEEYFEKLKGFAAYFNSYQLHRLIEIFLNLHRELKTTDKERFILEGAFFESLNYENFINLPALVRKIQTLEKALLEGGEFSLEKIKSEIPGVDEAKNKNTSSQIVQSKKKVEVGQNDTAPPPPWEEETENEKQEIEEEKEELELKAEDDSNEENTPLSDEEDNSSSENEEKSPEQIWRLFKARVAEHSPKWIAILSNIKTFSLEIDTISLEFISPYEEGFFKNEKQLISQLKDYFNKFKIKIRHIKTYVKTADTGHIKKEEMIEYIKTTFKGEEV